MSVLSPADIETLKAGVQNPMGFKLAHNALERSNLNVESDVSRNRLQRDFDTYDLPDLLSNQAARGAFASGATNRKKTRLGGALERSLGDITRGQTQKTHLLDLQQTGIERGLTGLEKFGV